MFRKNFHQKPPLKVVLVDFYVVDITTIFQFFRDALETGHNTPGDRLGTPVDMYFSAVFANEITLNLVIFLFCKI